MRFFEDMEFLRRASDICLFLGAAAFLLAVVLFFALDIRGAVLIETGMAERMYFGKTTLKEAENGGKKLPDERIDRVHPKKRFEVTRKIILVHTSEPLSELLPESLSDSLSEPISEPISETTEVGRDRVCGHQPMETSRT